MAFSPAAAAAFFRSSSVTAGLALGHERLEDGVGILPLRERNLLAGHRGLGVEEQLLVGNARRVQLAQGVGLVVLGGARHQNAFLERCAG